MSCWLFRKTVSEAVSVDVTFAQTPDDRFAVELLYCLVEVRDEAGSIVCSSNPLKNVVFPFPIHWPSFGGIYFFFFLKTLEKNLAEL